MIAVSLALFVVAACAPQAADPASGDTVTGIVWNWQSVTEKSSGNSTTVPDPESYTIIFNEDGTTEGQVDCNTFSGTYSREGSFTITVVPDVMAACDQGSLDQEYLTLLGDIAAGGPDGAGGLALETAGGAQRMSFSNGGAAP
jgi:heat shock protein HslJ